MVSKPDSSDIATAAKPAPISPAPAPAALISLTDYLDREPRLVGRPAMRGAFARACERAGLQRATVKAFAAQLTLFERGDH